MLYHMPMPCLARWDMTVLVQTIRGDKQVATYGDYSARWLPRGYGRYAVVSKPERIENLLECLESPVPADAVHVFPTCCHTSVYPSGNVHLVVYYSG